MGVPFGSLRAFYLFSPTFSTARRLLAGRSVATAGQQAVGLVRKLGIFSICVIHCGQDANSICIRFASMRLPIRDSQ
jgi:hypothetical protein